MGKKGWGGGRARILGDRTEGEVLSLPMAVTFSDPMSRRAAEYSDCQGEAAERLHSHSRLLLCSGQN